MSTFNEEKRKILVKSIFSLTSFIDLKRTLTELSIEKHLSKTKSINQINKYYKLNNFRYLKAIAGNPITPELILNELTNVKDVKYAIQIRNLASKNLSAR
ncbi:MAG TPA: hypothetical protein VHY08_12445 [Bacillota bacterium]|nr:hypothetical protein [Bacillota bacterium]